MSNLENKKNIRLDHIDIFKGILIIFVMVGHLLAVSFDLVRYFNWFHMPAFFIVAGIFFPLNCHLLSYLKTKSKSLLIPHFIYCLLGIIIVFIVGDIVDTKLFIKILIGGRSLVYPFTAFWFTTSFWGSVMIYALISQIKNRKYFGLLICLCYVIAHLESVFLHSEVTRPFWLKYFVWNLDVSLLGVVYLYIGSLLKVFLLSLTESKYYKQLLVFLSAGVCSLLFLYADHNNYIFLLLNMKYAHYTHWILDILVPLLFFLFIYQLAIYLCKVYICRVMFKNIGQASFLIMYLHVFIYYIFDKFQIQDNLILLFSSLVISMLFYFGVKKIAITKNLFLGKK